jgi:hypothetical protein
MFKLGTRKRTLAAAVAAIAALTFAITAAASPMPSLSFGSSNDGASAGWSNGKGSAIDLTLGTSAGSYAEITLHHLPALAVGDLAAPSFMTDNYNAGSPRYYLTLSDGHTLWGYPSNAGLNGGTFAWAVDNGNTYSSWDEVQGGSEASATVTGAYVIADADQAAGTTDAITGLTFGDASFN